MASVRIGLLTAHEGAAGLWAPSAIACAKLAAHELNGTGGLLRKHVELVSVNVGKTPQSAAQAARFVIDVEQVDAIVGMFPSYGRQPIASVIGRRVPYIYTPQFEGYETDRSVTTTGETARELLEPAIAWLTARKGGNRFFLCGSDYVWPRQSFAIAREIIRKAGGIVSGEMYMPLECQDYGAVLSAIRSTRADVVLPYFLGSDSIHFNRAFADDGLASGVVRFSSAIDETILYGLNENATENLYVSSSYFASLRSRNNGAFLERYHCFHGDYPPPANAFGQSCYEGIFCLASLVEEAETLRAADVRRAVGRTTQRKTARGTDQRPVAGAPHPVHIARVDGFEFTVLTA